MNGMGLANGKVDGQPIYVGDTVMISAKVLRSIEGVGAQVQLYSKTDEQQVWVAEDHLWFATVDQDLPAEPDDDTWIMVHDAEGMLRIFHRSDAEGHHDPNRRHDQHWWDVVDQRWIDWPAAVLRGAAAPGARRMSVQPGPDEPVPPTAE